MEPALFSPLLRSLGATHGFSLRTGGGLAGAMPDPAEAAPGPRAENPRRFADFAGIDAARIAQVVQVHGDRVVYARPHGEGVVVSDGPAKSPLVRCEADAIVAQRGAAAGVRTADCVPVLLFDPRSGAAAAVHAGWRGTAAKIVRRAVDALARDCGSVPAELAACIGPAIGRCCYEVSDDLAARFEADADFGPATTVRVTGRGPRLDLAEANRRLLAAAGLLTHRVEVLGLCTACDPVRFFSHRRDAGKTGRHLAVVASQE